MTDRYRASRTVRGLMVLASSLALVLAAVGTTVAHPASAVHVASSVQAGSLRNLITARMVLIEPGITDDELDEIVDQLVDDADDGDVETPEVDVPEVETPEVDVPEVETPEVDVPDAADDDQGDDNDDQGDDADDGDQPESDDGADGDGD